MMSLLYVVHPGWNPEEKPQSGPMGLYRVIQSGRTGARLYDLPVSLICGPDMYLSLDRGFLVGL